MAADALVGLAGKAVESVTSNVSHAVMSIYKENKIDAREQTAYSAIAKASYLQGANDGVNMLIRMLRKNKSLFDAVSRELDNCDPSELY